MSNTKISIITLTIIVLLLSGCSSSKKTEKELNLIMDTIITTESNQYFYDLVNSLLTNKETDELLTLASSELDASNKGLQSLKLKTKKAKDVKKKYELAFKNRDKVISMLKNNQVNESTKEEFKESITKAQENEYEAKEIIIKELNLKDIEG